MTPLTESADDQSLDRYEVRTKRAQRQATAFGVVITVAWVTFGYFSGDRPTAFLKGTYGDSFGVLTALFTGLALAGLWYTIQLQKIELAATREELRKQAESLQTQVIEGTFFQLLSRFSHVSEQVTIEYDGGYKTAAHGYFYNRANALFKSKLTVNNYQSNACDLASEQFSVVLSENQNVLAHYFRVLYHIFKFVDDSGLSDDACKRYASIARAQLSTHELLLLFYNGTVGEGLAGFKPLIEKYGLLKHVDRKLLFKPGHRDPGVFYEAGAFE